MPEVTHRKGTHRYVLAYESEADLGAICAAIIELTERPGLDFDIADAMAVAVAVADRMARDELQRTAPDVPAKPADSADGAELAPP
jgi:hypothetical protein